MIYTRLTGYRNLKFFAKLYEIKDYKKKIIDLAELFNLNEWLNQYVFTYSKGMKLKLALARLLLIDPKILFLDEPMLGLDPRSVKDVIRILLDLKKTIVITSHQMGVVSKICDRIAFLKEGEILNIDTQENLKKLITEKIKIQLQVSQNKNEIMKLLNQLEFVNNVKEIDGNIDFFINNESDFPKLFNFLKGFPVIKFTEIRPNLEDVFIKLSE